MAGEPRNAAVIASTKLNMKATRMRTWLTPTRISDRRVARSARAIVDEAAEPPAGERRR